MVQLKISGLILYGLVAAVSSNNGHVGVHFAPGSGAPVSVTEVPYQINLRYAGIHACSGALLIVNGCQVVVTVASCFKSRSETFFTVTAGELSQSEESAFEQTRNVRRIVIHEKYGVNGHNTNDIALVFFDGDFELNSYVSPIALPTKGQTTTGDIIVAGWAPDVLRKLQLPVIDDVVCAAAYFGKYFDPSMICAGHPGEVNNICREGAGSPLRAVNGDYLAGIASWGFGCGTVGNPVVSSEFAHFSAWVESNV